MDDDSQERLLGELLDMFLTAQQAGRPVKRIVGDDLEAFCRQFCSGLGWRNRGIDLLNSLASCAKWVLAFTVLELLCNLEDAALPELTTDVSGYILGWGMGLFVSLLVGMAVKGLMFRWKRISMGVYTGLLLGVLVAAVGGVRRSGGVGGHGQHPGRHPALCRHPVRHCLRYAEIFPVHRPGDGLVDGGAGGL